MINKKKVYDSYNKDKLTGDVWCYHAYKVFRQKLIGQ